MSLAESTIHQIFFEEFLELSEKLEADILALEKSPADSKAIMDRIFRHVHTIKGGAGFANFVDLARYAHVLEDFLAKVRSGQILVSQKLISCLLQALDCFYQFKSHFQEETPFPFELIQANLNAIEVIVQEQQHIVSGETWAYLDPSLSIPTLESEAFAEDSPQVRPLQPDQQTWLIQLRFNETGLLEGVDPLQVMTDLSQCGAMIVIPHVHAVPPLDKFDSQKLWLWWHVKLTSDWSLNALKTILAAYETHAGVTIQAAQLPPPDPGIASAIADKSQLQNPLYSVKSLQSELAERSGGRAATLTQAEGAPSENTASKVVSAIRVDSIKLEKLMNLVGEAVTNQSRLVQVADRLELVNEQLAEQLLHIVDDYDRTVTELQNQVMHIRMVPIRGMFAPFYRVVRDYSAIAGKKIQLLMHGEETEIDKTITEQLSGPLLHLIRNSMDHGIETIEERISAGKGETGVITLEAYHQEGHVVIEIRDDGRGINTKRVLAKAIEQKLVKAGDTLSDAEIWQFICQPGFSTAASVTEVSGRGVGMDVVKRSIENLRGVLEIYSKVDQGITFRIKLPLTLAIIEGMLVKVGDSVFTIPMLSIIESLKPQINQIKTLQNEVELIEVRGEYLPLLRLHQIFQIPEAETSLVNALVVIVEDFPRKVCLLVDEVLDQQPIVIKSLEENFIQLPDIAGATILGDGQVSLILDVVGLIRQKWVSPNKSLEKMSTEC